MSSGTHGLTQINCSLNSSLLNHLNFMSELQCSPKPIHTLLQLFFPTTLIPLDQEGGQRPAADSPYFEIPSSSSFTNDISTWLSIFFTKLPLGYFNIHTDHFTFVSLPQHYTSSITLPHLSYPLYGQTLDLSSVYCTTLNLYFILPSCVPTIFHHSSSFCQFSLMWVTHRS